jgi:hypothetical protein
MKNRIITAVVLTMLILGLSGFSGPVPPQSPPPLGPESELTTAGPDEYGYLLSDEGSFSFVDISGSGYSLPIADKNNGVATIPIRPFDYYSLEDLTTAYVSVNGFLSFEPVTNTTKSTVPKPFPTDSKPNALLAPFWFDLTLEVTSAIYIGTVDSPDPEVACSIIQWNNVKALASSEYYTFELILYDNGNIVFAYQPEAGLYAGARAGIEDADGVSGLNYAIPNLSAGKTVVITRPAAGVHLKARPQVSSGFFSNGETWFNLAVTNTTDSGTAFDTYSLALELQESDPDGLLYPWELTFFNPTCTTEITSIANLAKGATTQLCIRVVAGGDQVPGYYARYKVTLTSQADPDRTSTGYLQTAINSPFVQLFQDSVGGLKLDLNQVVGRTALDIAVPYGGSHMAMNMLRPGYYLITWLEGANIYYRTYKHFPGILGPINNISASPDDSRNLIDLTPAVAGSRDGYAGILYLMNQYQTDGDGHTELNANVYYSLVDSNGTLVEGYPLNMTNNAEWLDLTTGYPDPGSPIPQFQDPRIVPVGQDKMGLVWRTIYNPAGGASMDKIDYVIAKTDGSDFAYWEIQGWDTSNRHVYPATSYLDDGQFIISFINYTSYANPWIINYIVIDSDGNPSIPTTQIAGTNGWEVDLVQLGTGQVLFGWQDLSTSAISYAILSSNLIGLDVAPTVITYEDYPGHTNYRAGGYPSVTRSIDGNGIITWQDQDWQEQLYYTLLGLDGSHVTPPCLYRRVGSTLPEAQISTNDYGNAPLADEMSFIAITFKDYTPLIYYYFSVVFK